MIKAQQPLFEQFESKLGRSIGEKIGHFQNGSRAKHIIFASQFNIKAIDRLCRVAKKIELLSKNTEAAHDLTKVLREKRAVLFFTQPSTRTYASFVAACQLLGINYVDFRNGSNSSSVKGEHVIDSMRMFSTYNDVIIMRSEIPNLAECSAYLLNGIAKGQYGKDVHIVNGGSGADEHPTQALLDIFTISQAFDFASSSYSCNGKSYSDLKLETPNLLPGVNQKHYCFVGDLGRGRTVHSLVDILSLYKDVKISFVSPQFNELMLPSSLRIRLQNKGVNFIETDSINEIIHDVDALYVTRAQNEHGEIANDEPLVVDRPLVQKMPEHAIVMHPFPRNDELDSSVDSDFRAKYFQQARNGMWIRAALLCHLFDVEDTIQEIFENRGFGTFRESVDLG